MRKFFKDVLGITTPEQLEKLAEDFETDFIENPPFPEGNCYFCSASTTNYDFCHGCEQHICPDCMGPFELIPMGPHTIDAHKITSN